MMKIWSFCYRLDKSACLFLFSADTVREVLGSTLNASSEKIQKKKKRIKVSFLKTIFILSLFLNDLGPPLQNAYDYLTFLL